MHCSSEASRLSAAEAIPRAFLWENLRVAAVVAHQLLQVSCFSFRGASMLCFSFLSYPCAVIGAYGPGSWYLLLSLLSQCLVPWFLLLPGLWESVAPVCCLIGNFPWTDFPGLFSWNVPRESLLVLEAEIMSWVGGERLGAQVFVTTGGWGQRGQRLQQVFCYPSVGETGEPDLRCSRRSMDLTKAYLVYSQFSISFC